ncbi:MAG: PAS domain S-box protein, partial [bacterium]
RLRLYREIFLNSNDGIAIFSPGGYLKERNPAHKKYSGYGDAEAEGKNIIEFISDQHAQEIRQSLVRTGNYRGEITGHTKSGKSVDLDLSIFSIYGEKKKVNCYVGIARNISERKKAEIALREAHRHLEKRVAERTKELAQLNKKLREEIEERKQTEAALLESEAQIRAFLEAIPDLIFRLNRQGIYLDYQAPVGSDLAIPKEHVVGKHISETLPPDLTEKTLKSIRKALRTRQTQVLEYQLTHEKSLRDFEARIVVSGKDDVLAIVRDITDQKQAKEALQQARDQLEVRVKERTAELALLNDSLLQEITERVQAEETLAKRLHYEEGLAACSEALLTHDDMTRAITGALSALRDAVDISRVYLFENFSDEKDGLCMRQIYEVCAKGVKPEIDNAELQHFPYKEGFDRWKINLQKGSSISGLTKDFPEQEQAILVAQGIKSILVLPVMAAGKWFGFIGFDDVVHEKAWDGGDIRLLQTASEMIGNFLGKKSAENALKMSEERFRSLVENAHDIIYSMKPDGTFSYISPQFTKYTGYQVKEFLGKSLKPLIHPEDYTDSERKLEFRIIRKDGNWRWFTMHSTSIRDENEQIVETIGIAHDVTEIKNVLESLEKANKELRDTQLQLIQSEKMASLGMLVAGIAHEINTPVGAISSMHNTLMRATEKLNKELIQNYSGIFQQDKKLGNIFYMIDDAHKVISSASDRVTNIVRRLRSFARLDEAELKEVDIHDGIEDTLTIVHHELKHTVTVKKEYGKLPKISCYPGRLNQVFLNLLINAKQAIRDKGTISIRTYQQEKNVFIEIRDDGVGISQQNLKKIFDPGYTTKGVGVGTGLGLSIVYQIILDHRGKINVESEVGKGTVFTVMLPVNLEEILSTGR